MSRAVPAVLLVLALACAPVLVGCGDDTDAEQGLATPGATAPAPLPTTETAVPQPPKTPAPGQEDPASPPAATTTLEAPGADPQPRAPTVTEVQRPAKPVRCPAAGGFKGGEDAGGTGDFDARELLGLETAEAKAVAKRNDCAVRVVNRDGQELVRTMDYSGGRINVTETKGRIVALNGIG